MSDEVVEVTPNGLLDMVRFSVDQQVPLMIWGAPGIGKSQIVKQVALEREREVRDLRLSMKTLNQISGTPYFNLNKNTLEFAYDPLLPTDENDTSIVFLEEISTAPSAIQASAYQLVLDRRINEYVLPEGTAVIAAGNRETDRGVVHSMPKPLCDRFLHVDLKSDTEEWLEWAMDNNVHSDVIGFIGGNPHKLNNFTGEKATTVFTTPRTWGDFASPMMWYMDRNNITNKKDVVRLLATAIGEPMAYEFYEHRRIISKLPKISDILEGKIKDGQINKEIIAEAAIQYSIGISMVYELDELSRKIESDDQFSKMVENAIGFFNDYFREEFTVLMIRKMVMNVENFNSRVKPTEIPKFNEFRENFSELLGLS